MLNPIGWETAYSLRFVRFAVHGSAHCGILALQLSCFRTKIRHSENIPSPNLCNKIFFGQEWDYINKKSGACAPLFFVTRYRRRHTLIHRGPPAKIKIKVDKEMCDGHLFFLLKFISNFYLSLCQEELFLHRVSISWF